MLDVQTKSKTNLLPAVYDGFFSHSQLKPLVYKPTRRAYERNIIRRNKPKAQNEFSYMGFVIPFHPCMWDDKEVEAAWNKAMEMVHTKMKEKYTTECTNKLMARLNNMFGRLNFNTHRKSLVVTLTPDEEKIIYLSFPVRPAVFFSKSVSLLDLAANIQREADFYYLILNKGSVVLHDYNNKQLRKVYESNDETNTEYLNKKVSRVIELLNGKNEKPVFVTGSPNLVEMFCKSENYAENYFPLLYHLAPFSSDNIQSLVKEITDNRNYWQSKFIAGSVLLAQKRNGLISHTEAVLKALRGGADGLLLIDKRLKDQLQKPASGNAIFQMADGLISLIEKFLTRGNRFEITETGLLKDLGGIVLLKCNRPRSTAHKSYGSHAGAGGSLY